MRKNGFTLAEVLITLAIIGIVAAIVMPSVIASYQLKTVGVKLAKFAGTIENSARAFTASNGAFTQVSMEGSKNSQGQLLNDGSTTASNADLVNSFLADSLVVKGLYDAGENNYNTEKRPTQYTGIVYSKDKKYTDGEDIAISTKDKTEGTGDSAHNPVKGAVAVLKDNTKVVAYPFDDKATENWKDDHNINKARVGEGAFIISFDPNVAGLSQYVQKTFDFVVTEIGFVFPADTDPCLWAIYDNNWNSTAEIMQDTETTKCSKSAD